MSGGAQALLLVVLSAVAGFGANALREEPLPLTGRLGPASEAEAGADLEAASADAAAAAWEDGAFFLDVRGREEWEERRVAGSFWFGGDDFDGRYFEVLSGFGTSVPLLVYGAGPDSFGVRRTAAHLLELGHVRVDVAVCGLEGLLAAGVDPAEGPEEGGP